MTDNRKDNSWLFITLAAAGMLMIMMGARQAQGLFLFPISGSTGVGIVTISFAMAVGQFMWGAVAPVAGALADRFGPARVLTSGVLLLALGTALTPLFTTSAGLVFTIGILTAIGSGSGSFSMLIGTLMKRLPPAHRGPAAGIITAGGSFGQFVFAPAALPLVRTVSGPRTSEGSLAMDAADHGLTVAVRNAFRDRNYLLLHGSFLTCGFHIAFLVTHLPGEVDLCGLPASVASWSLAIIGLANIAGSFTAGWLLNRFRGKDVLFWMYGSRSILILLYLAAPKTEWTFYFLAVGLGFSWLGTAPPTAGVVGKLFGTRYLATLYGLTMVSHQVGGFFGAWLGGVAFGHYGNSMIAALLNLPIREPRVEAIVVPA